jgi:hypothetical protein
MLKKCALVLLCVVLFFSLSACNVKQKINEKIAEKVTEGVLEKIAGDGTNIDISEDGITFEGEGGRKITFGAGEWPKGGAADLIPEFKKGNIISVVNTDEGCMFIIEEVDKRDVENYIEDIKGLGYTKDVIEKSDDTVLAYIAALDSDPKKVVVLNYIIQDKEFTISVQVNE